MAMLFKMLPELTVKFLLLGSKERGLCAVGLSCARMLWSNIREGVMPEMG